MKNPTSNENGAMAIIVAILMVVLVGMTALAVDIGRLYEARRQMQTVADAAALAGAQELPEDPAEAVNQAILYGGKNNLTLQPENVQITQTYYPNDTIIVTVSTPVKYVFAPVLGRASGVAPAKAIAMVGSPTAAGPGVWPIGVMSYEASSTVEFGYTFGDDVQLKTPSKGSDASTDSAGNFFFLDLDDDQNGARVIYDALHDGGTENWVYVNQLYDTEPGINGIQVVDNIDGITDGDGWIKCNHAFNEVVADADLDGVFDLIDLGEPGTGYCHRIIVVPIIVNPEFPEGDPRRYNWSEVEGRKSVLILGFAYFYVRDWGTSGTRSWINGNFIRLLTPQEMRLGAYNPQYGVKAVKLTE